MAEPSGRTYGQALPDQVEKIAALFDAHLEVISDVRELYNARAALERDYAAKLQLLAKKAGEKKSKMGSLFILGNDPTKSWDANTLKQSTLNAAYDEIIGSTTSTSQDHVTIADALTSQVVEVLGAVERKNEEAKKKEMQYFQKLLADRDRVYADRLKSKQKYDEDCVEVESFRLKQGRASDDKHADRVAKQAEQQRNDMLNSKNVYLISTAIANQAKDKFYNEDIPMLENEFQTVQSRLVTRFAKILLYAQSLQLSHLDVLRSRITNIQSKLNQVDPLKDQSLFMDCNVKPFTAPGDWKFEPCSTHYDTNAMSIEPTPKVFIQNKLRRCREKMEELRPLIETKRNELNRLSSQVQAYTADHSLGTIDELTDDYLEAEHQLALYTSSERILTAEIETILAAVGDDEGAHKPHTFKSSVFSIPTQCGYCKSSIWGLTKQGKTCKLCGLSVHSKCELKIPADCQQSEAQRPSTLTSRAGTISSRTSVLGTLTMAPSPSSFVQSAAAEEPGKEESFPAARVLFDFSPTSEFELEVSEGAMVHIVEPDDGSGWVKVADEDGDRGLVPASYLESVQEVPGSKAKTAQRGSGKRVRAIYPYESQGSDELGLQEGDILELSSGPKGGPNYGGGWWEGFNGKGQKGIFPSNYVETV